MRLRLTRFDGLRLSLARGWYVVPSHMRTSEVWRLMDILRCGVDGILDAVEFDWSEWDQVSPSLSSATLAYVRAPGNHALTDIESRVAVKDTRLGLLHLPDAQCWPHPAWDELEVKPALAAWLRREFARPEHPLAPIGISNFPLDLLISVTAEPVELIKLVENTIAIPSDAGTTRERWVESAHESIAWRLVARLGTLDAAVRLEIADLVHASSDGHFKASAHRSASTELERLGLAIRSGNDVALGPLARSSRIAGVRKALDSTGLFRRPAPAPKSVEHTDAFWALDPFEDEHQTRLSDLTRTLAPLGYQPAHRIERLVRGQRGEFRRVVVAHQPGMGASTFIREALASLAAAGQATVFVDLFDGGHPGFMSSNDLLLHISTAIRGFADSITPHYPPAHHSRLQFPTARESEPTIKNINEHLDRIKSHLAARQQQLCIALCGIDETTDREHASSLLHFAATQLRQLHASLLIECSSADLMIPPGDRVAEILPIIHVPPLPIRAANDPREVIRPAVETTVRAILGARIDVDRLFPEPEALRTLIRLSGGCLRQLFNLARASLERAEALGLVAIALAHVQYAAKQRSGRLAAQATPSERDRLVNVAHERQLTAEDSGLVARSLVFVYEDGAWADVNPLLWTVPWMSSAGANV